MSKEEQSKEDKLNATLSMLKSGHLPDDPKAVVSPPQNTGSLFASASHHPQFHAAQQQLPRGRVAGSFTAAHDDADEDDKDSTFGNYYKISPNQKAFNEQVSGMYFGKNASPQSMPGSVVYPKVSLFIPTSHV